MKNFNNIYEEVYKKSFKNVEEKRMASKHRNIIVFSICFLAGIIFSIMVGNPLPIIIGLFLALTIANSSKANREYKMLYKELVIRNLIKEYNSEWTYKPIQGMSEREYSLCEFEKFDRFRSEDYIKGKLNNRAILDMAEVIIEDERHDNGKYYLTIFQGVFAKITLDIKMDSVIKIRKNKFRITGNENRLEMDSGEFEDIFDVYSEGKITAMQILTLETMQKIMDFTQKTKIVPEFTIKDNYIYIRFEMSPVFEPNIIKNSLDYETLKRYYDVINFIEEISKEILNNLEQ